ncbi:DUF563 domain-containing protein [Roseococcus sp. SYP-B2431]|uniref:glycosyltransferase family 61 protein n=1 Tax=Roseococcus sp. SYP-B2431 TaxID=2496640 RepID=UPI0013F45739|nr:glycosyltransferase family 61 protein [Roseococcus sp. SYP-B2431]
MRRDDTAARMSGTYRITGISDVVGAPVPTSRFSRQIIDPHQAFFGGRSVLDVPDLRREFVPPIGPSVTEPGLAERWQGYDAQYRNEARLSRFWVVELEQATVFPPFGIVAVGDRIVRDTVRNPKMLKSVFPEGQEERFWAAMGSSTTPVEGGAVPPAYRVPGRSFLLGYGLADNYFNWTLRYASRVAQYQAMPDVVQLAVPMPRRSYVPQTLEFLGVPQHEVIHIEAPMIFDRLVLVSPMAFGRYEISPQIADTLRGHPRVQELWRRPKRRIYVPRRNVRMRRVVNEAAVEEALGQLGFEVFDNAEHSVREQIRAFRDAAMVVSPHGAGLSNIAYCDAGTPVVELVPEGYDQGVTSYRSLADLFGLPYAQLFAREAKPDRKGNRCNSDIEVDVGELVRTIGAIAA